MGCALSGPGVNTGSRPAPEANESGSGTDTGTGSRFKSEPLPLSEAQKDLIRESWKILHDDIARVGIIMFIRLFETHPECKDVFFMFREIDDLQELRMSKELQAHGLRYEKRRALSYRFGALLQFLPYVGVQFISAVKPIVKENWTQEVEESWKSLFSYLTAVMKRGYHEEERKNGVNKTNYGTQALSVWPGGASAVHNNV
ncbi:UNVERIFIED_CONTAM: hypothetical protein FKN15_025480 [Acipenser sinensis]